MTRKTLAGLVRTQKNLFMSEVYPFITDQDSDQEADVKQRVYDAVVSTFEICAKIVEGTKQVGYLDPGSYRGEMQ